MTSVGEWIEEKIKNKYIRYFEYKEFSQISRIDSGSFGIVSKANSASAGLVALKNIFNQYSNIEGELNNDELIKELELLREVDNHPNINRILGITKDSVYYILVLEYANNGNLRNYLKKSFGSLEWNDKIQMALDITKGLEFLHSKGIIHRDLHSKNILVNNGRLLIADLGLSKKLAEIATNSAANKMGMVEYIEPQCFKNIRYKKDKKSDIYGLGVLLWEISSGHPPFSGCPRDLLRDHIKDGNREKSIEGTPPKYQQLYQECWDDEPKSRPDIEKVHEILCQLNTEDFFDLQSPQPYIHNIDDRSDHDDLTISSNFSSLIVGTASVVASSAIELVPFANFLPLIKEIGAIFDEIIDLVDAAEHNRRTCKVLENRVRGAESAVRKLKEERGKRKDFFNKTNYTHLQELSGIIVRIKNFISEISQIRTFIRFVKAKNVEKTFKELCGEFDSCVNLLSFSIDVKIDDELEQLKADSEDFNKYLEEMMGGIKTDLKGIRKEMMGGIKTDLKGIEKDVKSISNDSKETYDSIKTLSKEFSSTIAKVNAMHNTMEKFMNEKSQNQAKIDDIFQVHPLNCDDYEMDDDEKPRKDGRVTKWYTIRNESEELAFKIISEEEKTDIQNQVTIFKDLHDSQNIIKFYGLTHDGSKWYFVTEWAEYGNLREYYTNHKDRFNLRLKLRMSLDIARGLNFLKSVEIVHRDVRAENILITLNETAKLANFKYSRHLTTSTRNISQILDRARYCAPELLIRAPNFKYNQKCEVYSFGILLWEIAEERIPYQDNNDIVDITDKVRNKMYREPFSENSQMPEEFKKIAIEAVYQDPYFRPNIRKMSVVLRNCVTKQ